MSLPMVRLVMLKKVMMEP